ncbi:hypothetical protein [Zobellia galactanivorans]|uniref:Uncharacterized protein n=1 Tax=Zobellia galactanivorans (strain DSM 12802 / CCUG 47099 / CIP 106680 / NCIMB 13871 / Dsij) TaxID=63186 RepID=G0L6Q5_ZOBGA|nr:hypothetical protein [Zobellia galactanivorans]CAZ98584.1 Putative protein [Zobellia galactanivorans]
MNGIASFGTIDDNARSAEVVKVKYVENAIRAVENRIKLEMDLIKAIGCPMSQSMHQNHPVSFPKNISVV